ncbi:MAG: hypothetical protein KDE47_33505 [Caldilineaceae bacterium]|nr:hypothetical protein [Caldilineaceae bacterium]
MMILICGISSEAPVRLVIEAAVKQRALHVVFHQREAHLYDLHLAVDGAGLWGQLYMRHKTWRLNEFSGIYVRLMDYRDLPEHQPHMPGALNADERHKSALIHSTLDEWLEMASCPVLNRSSAMASNSSKPYQAQLIARAGLDTPATLVTNQPDAARTFWDEHERVIFKSISSIRSVVKELTQARLAELARIRFLPTQFQAYVPGTNIRVHVVGDELFATRIDTEAVDYRYAGQDGLDVAMMPIVLPDAIADRCRRLAHLLNLPLCGIDLKQTPDDQYVCFEVNPSPGYSYYQERTGQNIAGAIVRYLMQQEQNTV